MANVGFCPSMRPAYWGSTDWAGLDHMSSFQPFVWACLCGNRISCGHCAWGFNGPYIHGGASAGPQQKQIDTYKPQTHLARMTHFKWTKKGHFACWKA